MELVTSLLFIVMMISRSQCQMVPVDYCEVDLEYCDMETGTYVNIDITNRADYVIRQRLDADMEVTKIKPKVGFKRTIKTLQLYPSSPRAIFNLATAYKLMADFYKSGKNNEREAKKIINNKLEKETGENNFEEMQRKGLALLEELVELGDDKVVESLLLKSCGLLVEMALQSGDYHRIIHATETAMHKADAALIQGLVRKYGLILMKHLLWDGQVERSLRICKKITTDSKHMHPQYTHFGQWYLLIIRTGFEKFVEEKEDLELKNKTRETMTYSKKINQNHYNKQMKLLNDFISAAEENGVKASIINAIEQEGLDLQKTLPGMEHNNEIESRKEKQKKIISARTRRQVSTVQSICNGRLGNQISNFAALFAFEQKYGLIPRMFDFQREFLLQYFEEIDIPVVSNVSSLVPISDDKEATTESYQHFFNNPDVFSSGYDLNVGNYPIAFSFFKEYLQEIKNRLKLKPQFVDAATRRMRAIRRRYGSDKIVFVGIHIRRTDYEAQLKLTCGNESLSGTPRQHHQHCQKLSNQIESSFITPDYFQQGIQHFRNMFKDKAKVVFVVVSDDMAWIENHFRGVEDTFIGGLKATVKSSSGQAFYVVDDSIEVEFTSEIEDYPWVEIDLGADTKLDRLLLFSSTPCAQFSSIQARISNQSFALNESILDSNIGVMCYPATDCDETPSNPRVLHVMMNCQDAPSSRYILIQSREKQSRLQLAQVVWLHPGEEAETPSSNSTMSIGRDLALLAKCDHSLLTYGTFGLWGAIFNGGHAVMPRGYTHTDSSLVKEIQRAQMQNWSFMQV